jgi:metallophosphoesterase superfamily enzyme
MAHSTESLGDTSQYGLVGHIHPQIVLSEGKKKLRLPCFWFGERYAVLPAFGEFTGCATVVPASGDRAFVIADGRVIEIPTA